jgi:hypothetical protein
MRIDTRHLVSFVLSLFVVCIQFELPLLWNIINYFYFLDLYKINKCVHNWPTSLNLFFLKKKEKIISYYSWFHDESTKNILCCQWFMIRS